MDWVTTIPVSTELTLVCGHIIPPAWTDLSEARVCGMPRGKQRMRLRLATFRGKKGACNEGLDSGIWNCNRGLPTCGAQRFQVGDT